MATNITRLLILKTVIIAEECQYEVGSNLPSVSGMESASKVALDTTRALLRPPAERDQGSAPYTNTRSSLCLPKYSSNRSGPKQSAVTFSS